MVEVSMVERVAEGLTEAQYETIFHAWPYPDYHRNGPQISYCPVWRNDSSRRSLDRKRLIASEALGGPRLRPLGLAVRTYLHSLLDSPHTKGDEA